MKDWGVVVPIVTPCRRSGEIDLEGLQVVCQDMIRAGCAGIFVAGSSGRGPWFSRDDRIRMCRAVADCVDGKTPALAGCMASGLPGMLENAFAMADAGAQMAVVTVPAYFNYSQIEVETIFRKFADDSPLPVVIYDIPDLARMKLDAKLLLRLAQHENVVGIKDSSADYEKFRDLLIGLGRESDFYLLQGKEKYLADSLVEGASGIVVSMVQIDPDLFVALYQAVRAGNIDLALEIQAEVDKLVHLFEASFARRPETSTLFHLLHLTMEYRGIRTNLLLDHDGSCPDWLADNARQASDICQSARNRLLPNGVGGLVETAVGAVPVE